MNKPLTNCTMKVENDIFYGALRDSVSVDLAIAKELVSMRLNLTENKMHYLITDLSNVRQVSAEAKVYLQNSDTGLKNILAAAFIVTSPVASMIANVFIKAPRNFEARIFTNKEDALDWISEMKKNRSI